MTDNLDSTPSKAELINELKKIITPYSGALSHEQLSEFIIKHPEFGYGYFYLGFSYLIGRFINGLEYGTQVIQFGGSSFPTESMILKNLNQAEKNFVKSMELDPSLKETAQLNIAMVKLSQGKYSETIAYIEDKLDNVSDNIIPLYKQYLGAAYREVSKYDTALEIFDSLQFENLNNINLNYALTYLRMGKLKEARQRMELHLTLKHTKADQYIYDAISAEINEDIDSALSNYGKAKELCEYNAAENLKGINVSVRLSTIYNR